MFFNEFVIYCKRKKNIWLQKKKKHVRLARKTIEIAKEKKRKEYADSHIWVENKDNS